MNIKEKQITSFLLLSTLVIGVNIINIRVLQRVEMSFRNSMKNTVPSLTAWSQIASAVYEMKGHTLETVMARKETSRDSWTKDEITKEKRLLESIRRKMLRGKSILSLSGDTSPERKREYDRFIDLENTFHYWCWKIMSHRGVESGKRNRQLNRLRQVESKLSHLLETNLEQCQKKLELGYKDTGRSFNFAKKTGFYSMAGVVLLALIMGFYTAAKISRPIVHLMNSAQRVGRGDLTVRACVHRRDELGVLAREFNQMVENLDLITVSRQYVNNILQAMRDSLLVVNLSGRVQKINRAARNLLGGEERDLLNQPIEQFFHRGKMIYDKEQYKPGRHLGSRERIIFDVEGTAIPVVASTSLLQNEMGETEGEVWIVQDIRERKRLEEEILKVSDWQQKRIGQDLHDELGQQLGGVVCLVRTLEQDLLEEGREEGKQLSMIVDYLSQAVSQTRSLAQGLYPVQLEVDGLYPALAELAQRLKRMYTVQVNLDCSAPLETLPVDRSLHIFRIIQEAASNAVKHGEAQVIDITIKKAEHRLLIVVADDGRGVVEVEKEGPTTGLGIHIMHYRTGILGGNLHIGTGRSGSGTEVTLSLPCTR